MALLRMLQKNQICIELTTEGPPEVGAETASAKVTESRLTLLSLLKLPSMASTWNSKTGEVLEAPTVGLEVVV